MNLRRRTYHYIGEITLKENYTLKERFSDEDIDPWLFLVFDKKGERRYTFFYKIEQPSESFCGKSFNILLHFIMDEVEKIIRINQTYDVWLHDKSIGKVKIIKSIERNQKHNNTTNNSR